MLEKPSLPDSELIVCLNQAYGLSIQAVLFLPLGADADSAVYQALLAHGSMLVKLRRNSARLASVAVPTFLADAGHKQFIPALKTRAGHLWCQLREWFISLHHFVEGHNGYEQQLNEHQWAEFGAAVRLLHTTEFPESLGGDIPREDFAAPWPEELAGFLDLLEVKTFKEPSAAALVQVLRSKRSEILGIIDHARHSRQLLVKSPPPFVLCHADCHGWNLLIDRHNGALFLIDWDTLISAPKERDLMFIGAGFADSGYTAGQETTLFFKGYGQCSVNQGAIRYYRCMRILEDLVIYCRQLLLSEEGGKDRLQAVEYARANFRPGGTIAMATQPLTREDV